MNEITEEIERDANILLHDIRHMMATLADISLTVETIMCNSCTLVNEFDVEMLSSMFVGLNDEAITYGDIMEEFNVDMVQLMENIKQVI